MDGKLKQDRKQDVKVKDVTQRSLLGQLFNRLIKLFSLLAHIEKKKQQHTLALEIHKKQTLINIPVIVTW